uniref:Uncharacterized protein n=1 Tax=Arundo donax TaxID=35708 RepID=A0A0A8YLA5_ARUDO
MVKTQLFQLFAAYKSLVLLTIFFTTFSSPCTECPICSKMTN